MDHILLLWKFLLTFLFALSYGLERQRSNKPVGFGTFIFVSIGSCGLSITATELNSANPLPLLSGIITGIGFLGAGALIKTTDKIHGFTTASSIWIFAIIGLTIGVGEFEVAIMMFVIIWMVLGMDKVLKQRGIGYYRKRLTLTYSGSLDLDHLMKFLDVQTYETVLLEWDKTRGIHSLTSLVHGTRSSIERIPEKLELDERIDSYSIV